MTVSSSIPAFNQIDSLILAGFKRAGLIPLEAAIGFDATWPAKSAYGREVLNRVVQNLSNEGYLSEFIAIEIVQLTAGVNVYVLDPVILNVVDSASNIPASNGSEVEQTVSETPVSPMSRYQWNLLSTKDATGTPTRYFLDRNGPAACTLHLWPIPSESSKLRLMAQRIPADNSVGSNTMDLKRNWDLYLVASLGFEIATDAKLPIDERQLLKQDRDELMARIRTVASENEGPDVQFMHSTPWTSGYR